MAQVVEVSILDQTATRYDWVDRVVMQPPLAPPGLRDVASCLETTYRDSLCRRRLIAVTAARLTPRFRPASKFWTSRGAAPMMAAISGTDSPSCSRSSSNSLPVIVEPPPCVLAIAVSAHHGCTLPHSQRHGRDHGSEHHAPQEQHDGERQPIAGSTPQSEQPIARWPCCRSRA